MTQRLLYLTQLLEEGSKDPFVLFAIAKEHEKSGDSAMALAFYERLSTEYAAYVGTYYHFGKLLEQQERISEAIEVYRTGIRTAVAANDVHAASELRGALLSWEDE